MTDHLAQLKSDLDKRVFNLIDQATNKMYEFCSLQSTTATSHSQQSFTKELFSEMVQRFNRQMDSEVMRPLYLKLYELIHLFKRVQFRFPRCKSKRISKKWMKKESNFKTIHDTNIYITQDGKAFCHPIVADEIRRMDEK